MGEDFLDLIEERRAELDREDGRRNGAPSPEESRRGIEAMRRLKREKRRRWKHRVLKAVRDDPGLSQSELADRIDASRSWTSELVQDLEAEGVLRVEVNAPRSGSPGRWHEIYPTRDA